MYFGNYWQNDTNGDGVTDQNDGKEPIKWRVLAVNGDDAFLLADQNLDGQPYNEVQESVTWETCTLRSWLNNNFYQNAFSVAEQSAIQITTVKNTEKIDDLDFGKGNDTEDRVYLLSLGEVMNPSYGFASDYSLFSDTRSAKNTEFYRAEGNELGYGDWWLRTPDDGTYDEGFYGAMVVPSYGAVYTPGTYVDDNEINVRPALHLNLSSSMWSPAGTVSASVGEEADEEGNEDGSSSTAKPTQTPTATPKPTAKPTTKPTSTPKPSSKTVNKPRKVAGVYIWAKKGKKIRVTWYIDYENTSGYQIQYAQNRGFTKKKKSKSVSGWTKESITINGLKKGKTYYVRVRAYNKKYGKKVYGKWSKVKKVKIKK